MAWEFLQLSPMHLWSWGKGFLCTSYFPYGNIRVSRKLSLPDKLAGTWEPLLEKIPFHPSVWQRRTLPAPLVMGKWQLQNLQFATEHRLRCLSGQRPRATRTEDVALHRHPPQTVEWLQQSLKPLHSCQDFTEGSFLWYSGESKCIVFAILGLWRGLKGQFSNV